MRHKKAWCGFFGTMSAITVGGIAATTAITQKYCPLLSNKAASLIQFIVDGKFNASSAFAMDLHLSDSDTTFPLSSNNLMISIVMEWAKTFGETLESVSSDLETGCHVAVGVTGSFMTLNLLIAAMMASGAIAAYKYSQKPEEDDQNDSFSASLHGYRPG